MARGSTDIDEDQTAVRRGCGVGAEGLRLVQEFLIARAGRRDVEPRLLDAWNRFYSVYDPIIRKSVCGRRQRVDDAEDQAQEISRVVVARLATYDARRGPFHRWLSAVIRHALIDQQRRRRPLCLSSQLEVEIRGAEPDPASLCELTQSRERVAVAIEKLRARISADNFQILYEHSFAGTGFASLAMSLGLTVKQVRDRHRRATVRLRDLLVRDEPRTNRMPARTPDELGQRPSL